MGQQRAILYCTYAYHLILFYASVFAGILESDVCAGDMFAEDVEVVAEVEPVHGASPCCPYLKPTMLQRDRKIGERGVNF